MNPSELNSKMKAAPLIDYDHRKQVPEGSGLYAAWLDDDCFYVGKAPRNLRNRVSQHFKGQRGCDQFCLYVYDWMLSRRFPETDTAAEVRHKVYNILEKGFGELVVTPAGLTRQLNHRMGEWIRKEIRFRCLSMAESELANAETILRWRSEPTLNPLIQAKWERSQQERKEQRSSQAGHQGVVQRKTAAQPKEA